MRFVTYSTSGGPPVPGVELPDVGIVSVRDVLGVSGDDVPVTVARLLGAPAPIQGNLIEILAAAQGDPERAAASGRLIAPEAARLHAPLGESVLLVCAGANYRSHLDEMGEKPPEKAPWFLKNPNAVIGTGEAIRLPGRFPDHVDFEGELCVVFGRPCHNVAAEDAYSYIAGYTIMNDVSARDPLSAVAAAVTPEQGRYAWTDMLLAKQFPTFAPLGPAVVTADEVGDPADLRLVTTLNGTVMQDASVADLVFDVPSLVEQMSRFFRFEPGDVLSTGTPAGVGAARDPAVYLRPGDVISVEVTGVGALFNPVAGPAETTFESN